MDGSLTPSAKDGDELHGYYIVERKSVSRVKNESQ